MTRRELLAVLAGLPAVPALLDGPKPIPREYAGVIPTSSQVDPIAKERAVIRPDFMGFVDDVAAYFLSLKVERPTLESYLIKMNLVLFGEDGEKQDIYKRAGQAYAGTKSCKWEMGSGESGTPKRTGIAYPKKLTLEPLWGEILYLESSSIYEIESY